MTINDHFSIIHPQSFEICVCVCICAPPVLCTDEAPVRGCVDVCNLIMPYAARTPEAHRLCITAVQRVQTRFLRARKTCTSKRPLNVPIASKNCIFQVIGRHRFPWTLSRPAAHLERLHLHGSTVPPRGGTGPFLQLSLTSRSVLSMDQGQSLRVG